MAELVDVFNAMFKDRSKWKLLLDEDKEKSFFIVNRMMSKKYSDKSQLFNDKLIDKVSAMDIWYLFTNKISYPKWFWSKSTNSKIKPLITEKEVHYLMTEFDIKKDDIDILIKYYPQEIKEELKYYNETQKGNK